MALPKSLQSYKKNGKIIVSTVVLVGTELWSIPKFCTRVFIHQSFDVNRIVVAIDNIVRLKSGVDQMILFKNGRKTYTPSIQKNMVSVQF